MRIIIAVTALLILNSLIAAQGLPHYMNEAERKAMENYVPPVSATDDTNPPPTPVRTMAEWEEVQGIIVAWTSYTTIIRQIVDYAQDECLVFIVSTDSNSVKSFLTSGGVPLVNLKFVQASFNSVWCRDYGPWAVYSGVADSLKLVDWIYNRPRPLDDQVSVAFANYASLPIYQTTVAPNNLIATGGNFMVDGHGTGFSSRLIIDENPTQNETQINNIMNMYMGISRYIKMETLPYDQIHHIDMHMKLLDEETIMVGEYPAGVADGPQIEANLQYVLSNFQTCFGRPYKVVRIPMPPSASGQYPPNSNYYTYTNSVFVNKTVIVPVYGLSQDSTALGIYREALPGYRVVGINSSGMISALGAIHCITKEIGVSEPVFISHAKLLNNSSTTVPYQVKAYVKSRSGISGASLYWRTDTTQAYSAVAMTLSQDTFRASIPAQPLGTNVYYYVSATSNSGRTVTKPITAPQGYIRFRIDNQTGITGTHISPGEYSLSQNYPNPFNPQTVILFNLPSKSYVSLKVYDALGREIAEAASGVKEPGVHKVTFDAGSLSAGVYFYSLTAGEFADTKKMLIVK
ncbi:MAG: agmatine deiminase family protein [Ignavibacteria bacterium]|nr:agmatine deiminase family protein [Ignavibacteria bacterium]